MSSKDVAYHMTSYDWELFHCVHEVWPDAIGRTDWLIEHVCNIIELIKVNKW